MNATKYGKYERDDYNQMNEVERGLTETKMKHGQWGVDWSKWNETWTMKSIM